MKIKSFKKNIVRGFTLVEMLISILIFSMVLLLFSTIMVKLEDISTNSVNKMTSRKFYNMFVWEFSNSVDSLSSSYFENKEGIIVNNLKNKADYDSFKTSSDEVFLVETDDFSMFLNESRVKQDVKVKRNELQYEPDNMLEKIYGYIEFVRNDKDNIIGKNQLVVIKEDKAKKDKKGQLQKSYFEIKVSDYDKNNDIYKLEQIKTVFYIEKSKGLNELVELIYTCQQEVLVKIVN